MPDLTRRWSRWRELSGPDRRSLVALIVLLPIADLALRTVGLRVSQRWLMRWTRSVVPQACATEHLAYAQRLAELAAIAGARGLYPNTCLRQALVIEYWLRRRGLPAQLRVGARKQASGSLDAHAWVELEGIALAQANLRHVPFADLERRLR